MPSESPPPSDIDVWILAGQSNMHGCGLLAEGLPSHPAIWSFAPDDTWAAAVEPLHRPWESTAPVHQALARRWLPPADRELPREELARRDRTNLRGVGPGPAFAQTLHAATGRSVGLIPCAQGGTTLEEWSPTRRADGGHSLYGAMLERVARAGRPVRGLLWYQGESDASYKLSLDYGERLAAWISAVRRDLAQPSLPVGVVQIGRFVGLEPPAVPDDDIARRAALGWNNVRHAQFALSKHTPGVFTVTALDLGLEDFVHLNATSVTRVGRRLAHAFLAREAGAVPVPSLHAIRLAAIPGYPRLDAIDLDFYGVSGGWLPCDNVAGFGLHRLDGTPHPSLAIVNVAPLAAGSSTLRVRLTGKVDNDCALGYGWGRNPFVNAVDTTDQALPSFAPVTLLC
jgi:sialate O-acetylesterase